MQKLKNHFEFFKSTLLINLVFATVSVLFGLSFEVILLTIGFVITILMKEIYNKNDYLFYFNNGISKYILWGTSYLLTLILVICIVTIKIFLRCYIL